MSSHRMEAEEEALFRSYPYALYFVQSPSTVLSRANSADACHSPRIPSENFINNHPAITNANAASQEVTRFSLSRYSASSRGSNNSFLHEKKIPYDLQSHGNGTVNGENRLIINDIDDGIDQCDDDDEEEEEEEEEDYFGRKSGWWWWRYLSFRHSSSCLWISLQISWRLMVSLGIALLVFYIATKPPPPNFSIKMAGIRQFGLGEGVDASGVTTKILTCNCSMDLVIDNKSKLFGLHIHPPVMELSFSHLPFAISYGPELYAYSDVSTSFQLYVGTRNKPMYGAGTTMQDMLDSGEGLQLLIRVSLRSSFRVVWSLIKPKFHHQAECLLVLNHAYDKKHRNQAYNSSCIITS